MPPAYADILRSAPDYQRRTDVANLARVERREKDTASSQASRADGTLNIEGTAIREIPDRPLDPANLAGGSDRRAAASVDTTQRR